MKYLVITLLLLSTGVQAQDKPFKGAQKVVVAVDTIGIMDRLNMALIEQGFTIKERNDNLKYILTEGRNIKKHSALLRVRAMVKGDQLHISGATTLVGSILTGDMNESYSPLKFVGQKGSINKDSWQELESIAIQFGKELKYE